MTTLEEAEREIREGGPGLTREERQAIAQELDRLRAEVAAFKGEAAVTVYVYEADAAEAIETIIDGGFACSTSAIASIQDDGSGDVYAVTLTARKVQT